MNCLDCQFHKIINDRDPDDWFCDDDVAVLCQRSPIEANSVSRYRAERFPLRRVTSACRPYNARKESQTPKWCPLGLGANSDIRKSGGAIVHFLVAWSLIGIAVVGLLVFARGGWAW